MRPRDERVGGRGRASSPSEAPRGGAHARRGLGRRSRATRAGREGAREPSAPRACALASKRKNPGEDTAVCVRAPGGCAIIASQVEEGGPRSSSRSASDAASVEPSPSSSSESPSSDRTDASSSRSSPESSAAMFTSSASGSASFVVGATRLSSSRGQSWLWGWPSPSPAAPSSACISTSAPNVPASSASSTSSSRFGGVASARSRGPCSARVPPTPPRARGRCCVGASVSAERCSGVSGSTVTSCARGGEPSPSRTDAAGGIGSLIVRAERVRPPRARGVTLLSGDKTNPAKQGSSSVSEAPFLFSSPRRDVLYAS